MLSVSRCSFLGHAGLKCFLVFAHEIRWWSKSARQNDKEQMSTDRLMNEEESTQRLHAMLVLSTNESFDGFRAERLQMSKVWSMPVSEVPARALESQQSCPTRCVNCANCKHTIASLQESARGPSRVRRCCLSLVRSCSPRVLTGLGELGSFQQATICSYSDQPVIGSTMCNLRRATGTEAPRSSIIGIRL